MPRLTDHKLPQSQDTRFTEFQDYSNQDDLAVQPKGFLHESAGSLSVANRI